MFAKRLHEGKTLGTKRQKLTSEEKENVPNQVSITSQTPTIIEPSLPVSDTPLGLADMLRNHLSSKARQPAPFLPKRPLPGVLPPSHFFPQTQFSSQQLMSLNNLHKRLDALDVQSELQLSTAKTAFFTSAHSSSSRPDSQALQAKNTLGSYLRDLGLKEIEITTDPGSVNIHLDNEMEEDIKQALLRSCRFLFIGTIIDSFHSTTIQINVDDLTDRNLSLLKSIFEEFHNSLTSFEGAGLTEEQINTVLENVQERLLKTYPQLSNDVDASLSPPSMLSM